MVIYYGKLQYGYYFKDRYTYSSAKQNRESRNRPTHLWSIISAKVAGTAINKIHFYSTNGPGTNGHPLGKEINLNHNFTPYTKDDSKLILDLSKQANTIKPSEGRKRKFFCFFKLKTF